MTTSKATSRLFSKDGQVWKAITLFEKWPMEADCSWTENDIVFEFHSGTDPLKPTMLITNQGRTSSRLELKLHFINATNFKSLQTIPDFKVVLNPEENYVSFTRWNKIFTSEPVLVLTVVQAFEVLKEESKIKAHEDILMGLSPSSKSNEPLVTLAPLQRILQKEWQTQELSDVCLVSKDKRYFKANRMLLALRSKVFKPMFFGDLKCESEQDFPTMTGDVLRAFLEFMYTDNICEKLSDESLFQLLKHAHMYDCVELMEFCLGQVKDRMEDKSLKLSSSSLIVLFRVDRLDKSHLDYIRYNLFETLSDSHWKDVQNIPELKKSVTKHTLGDPEWIYYYQSVM